MITEIALLQIRPGQADEFEKAFRKAEAFISCQKGYRGHSLKHCLEDGHRYLLQVEWDSLEDHTTGFRQSAEYGEWKKLLHHFYDPFPVVEHFKSCTGNYK